MDLLKINGVGNPRISPDGSRVAYTVSEVKMEKDKEWKTVTQVWVVPMPAAARGNSRAAKRARVSPNGRRRLDDRVSERSGKRRRASVG
jgi:Tol biopolymer transport system component